MPIAFAQPIVIDIGITSKNKTLSLASSSFCRRPRPRPRPRRPHLTTMNINDNDTAKTVPKMTVVKRTCRLCKGSYDPTTNHPTACRYHSGLYTGDSKRKGEWERGPGGYSTGDGSAERFWWCCGETGLAAPGCCVSKHKSYDEED